jgi:hypothetical protein
VVCCACWQTAAEYCGQVEHHDYELYLGINDIGHTKTKAPSPKTNSFCERFYKTILKEFYQVMFCKKIYNTLDGLQKDLDDWLYHYNHQRTRQGKTYRGRIPDCVASLVRLLNHPVPPTATRLTQHPIFASAVLFLPLMLSHRWFHQ